MPTDPAANLPEYYSHRAPEYEAMWRRNDPVRQAEQAAIVGAMRTWFRGRRVLEVACGTGYWTQFLVPSAERVCGIDVSAQMLALARAKPLPPEKVTWLQADAYSLSAVPGQFDAGLANFWFSHVPRTRLGEFLAGFHRRIGAAAVVFMADNVFVPGLGGECVTVPGSQDTFKRRELADGSKHIVLKNYYDADRLRRILEPWSAALSVRVGQCFWWVQYQVRESP
ncbi:MAG: methyltransferase domain-containing protein [Verrucomicrobia bacterium]|nr:methyltransferase domain-containing protein [Verrucomicrobiota bacterium]